MPKMIKQANRPQKTCLGCGRPFMWRKKWEKNWDEVKYCAKRCRQTKTDPHLIPLLKD